MFEGTFPSPIEIRTDDPEGCPAFYGCVIRGLRNGPSPAWLQQRLKAVGQRPISALVDMTNFIMLSYGRPLHVYNLAKLKGPLVARKARDGEQLLALNDKTYTLDGSMTVIADDAGVHDIGGIMGGEHSGVTEATTDIVIECAYFDPETIARTGQKLALTSDARTRFERGVDPAFLDSGLALAVQMAVELAGGEVSQPIRAGTPPRDRRPISYRPQRCEELAGVAVAADRQRQVLERLGFAVSAGETWTIEAPSWRRDVEGSADIVEEVIRIEGLDKVPSTPLPRSPGVARPTATPQQLIERRVRRAAAARGLNEAVTWSFLSEAETELFGGSAWILANPISEEMKAMRPSLLPGLLAAAQRNMARGAKSVRLFEVGRRYLAGEERPTVGIVLAGDGTPRDWRTGKAQPFEAFDAKAEAVALLEAAGAPVANLQTLAGESAAFHPGRSARLGLGPKNVLALFGELHPQMVRAFDLEGPVAAAEIYLDAIPARRASGRMRDAYAPPALQAVERDFAFLVPQETAAEALLRAVRGADKVAIADVRLFDVFEGGGVPDGQKSLAIEVMLQPADKSFTDADLQAISDRIVAAATKLGAQLRG
jgi:phenylalanyl-tRNA synthetase beta chain